MHPKVFKELLKEKRWPLTVLCFNFVLNSFYLSLLKLIILKCLLTMFSLRYGFMCWTVGHIHRNNRIKSFTDLLFYKQN